MASEIGSEGVRERAAGGSRSSTVACFEGENQYMHSFESLAVEEVYGCSGTEIEAKTYTSIPGRPLGDKGLGHG
jgi:hypothetical protein